MNFIVVLLVMLSSSVLAMSVDDRAICVEVATDMNGQKAITTTERWVKEELSETRFQCAFIQTSGYGRFHGEFITDLTDAKNSFIQDLLKNCQSLGGIEGNELVNGTWLTTCTHTERANESTDRMMIRRTVYAEVPFFVLKSDSTFATSTSQTRCFFP